MNLWIRIQESKKSQEMVKYEKIYVFSSVAEPKIRITASVQQPVWRIRDCLSRILIFLHPGSRIQQQQKKGGGKISCPTF
jgi:hypothetical protein